jgi:hypothetical protein
LLEFYWQNAKSMVLTPTAMAATWPADRLHSLPSDQTFSGLFASASTLSNHFLKVTLPHYHYRFFWMCGKDKENGWTGWTRSRKSAKVCAAIMNDGKRKIPVVNKCIQSVRISGPVAAGRQTACGSGWITSNSRSTRETAMSR